MNKLKDVAGLLKAKITKDELQEALINATSEQNWQASTHILHEIANAAYNYQKWQQINEFIWEKLKKGKSWRKILKTLGLVDFLLKNGPPSIISSFKYDIYQFRSFDNFSHYDEGVDRGQAIRQKAKLVVDLLSNQELLQEQRVKAKTIRQRMGGVVSGSNYGGINADKGGFGGAKYGSIDNKSYQSGGYSGSSTNHSSNQGGLGTYGDYNYNKSTLDKYKDNKTPSNTASTIKKTLSAVNSSLAQQKKQPVIDNKKPFERIAPKLVKPGSKPTVKVQNSKPSISSNIMDDDILGGSPVQSVQKPQLQQPVIKPQQVPTHPQESNILDFGFGIQTPKTVPNVQQIAVEKPVQQQGMQQQGMQQQGMQQQGMQQQGMQQQGMQQQQSFPNQNGGFPNANPMQQNYYGQQMPLNYGMQGQGQQLTIGGYQQPMMQQQPGMYNQQYQQPMMQGGIGMGYNNTQMAFNQTPQYQQTANQSYGQPQNWANNISLSTTPSQPAQKNLSGVTLQSTTKPKKQEEQFGNFSSGQNNNVKWLSNDEKGLIDFSDFGEELKNGGNNKNQQKNNANSGNNIDTTWNW